MSHEIDRILNIIDNGLATAPTTEPAYSTDDPDLCWRCQEHPTGDGATGVCPWCRDQLHTETPAPASPPRYRQPTIGAGLADGPTIPGTWVEQNGVLEFEPDEIPHTPAITAERMEHLRRRLYDRWHIDVDHPDHGIIGDYRLRTGPDGSEWVEHRWTGFDGHAHLAVAPVASNSTVPVEPQREIDAIHAFVSDLAAHLTADTSRAVNALRRLTPAMTAAAEIMRDFLKLLHRPTYQQPRVPFKRNRHRYGR